MAAYAVTEPGAGSDVSSLKRQLFVMVTNGF